MKLFIIIFTINQYYQVRDITSNPEWERAYQYEIPVLAKVLSDGTEVSCLFHPFINYWF